MQHKLLTSVERAHLADYIEECWHMLFHVCPKGLVDLKRRAQRDLACFLPISSQNRQDRAQQLSRIRPHRLVEGQPEHELR